MQNHSLVLGDPEITANMYCSFAYLYWEGCLICSIYICGNFWVTHGTRFEDDAIRIFLYTVVKYSSMVNWLFESLSNAWLLNEMVSHWVCAPMKRCIMY